MLTAWARLMVRRRGRVLAVAGLFLVLSVAAILRGGILTTGMIDGIEAERGAAWITKGLGVPVGSSAMIVFSAPAGSALTVDDPAFRQAVEQALAPLRGDAAVLSVETPYDVPEQLAVRWRSADGRHLVAHVTMREPFRTASLDYPRVRALLGGGELDTLITGYLEFKHELDVILARDLLKAELISVPLALIVLLLVFSTVCAAAVPILVGGLAVVGGVAAVMLLSHVTDIAQYTINVVTLIGLGVAIDYSLFIVSRYREELARCVPMEVAIERAVATAGRAVSFSGLAVGIGIGALLFFPRSYLFAMGLGGAIVVLLAVISALTVLPALLAVLGPRIHAGPVPIRMGSLDGVWRRIAHAVMARPVLVLIPTLGLVALLGSPFVRLEMAAADVRVLPASAEARRGHNLLAEVMPDVVANQVVVVVRFPTEPALTAPRIGALYDFSRQLAGRPGVRKVDSIVDLDARFGKDVYEHMLSLPSGLFPAALQVALKKTTGGGIVLLVAMTEGPSESPEARALVAWLREHRQIADGELLVTGQTANDVDSTAFIVRHTPTAIGFVVLLTMVILFFLLDSVILPIKAVLMNLLSIAASFGALVFIFQDGHFAGLLGFEPRPVEPTLPLLLFCTLFGLSMDYEVLLLTRIQEEYERTGDNAGAVAEGLERSGRLITSAAAIMVAVFAAFASAEVVLVKAMGLGMALAVALDASLVRVLIVPATMRLFGDLNWWMPGRRKP
jgi:putative drug exporter of the RND superfamily